MEDWSGAGKRLKDGGIGLEVGPRRAFTVLKGHNRKVK